MLPRVKARPLVRFLILALFFTNDFRGEDTTEAGEGGLEGGEEGGMKGWLIHKAVKPVLTPQAPADVSSAVWTVGQPAHFINVCCNYRSIFKPS